jgi:WD40 repeat protein
MATDSEEIKENFLLCMDLSTMLKDSRDDPIRRVQRIDQHVRDLQWLSPDTFACAFGNGSIGVYSISSQYEFKLHGHLNDIHSQPVRELAVNQIHPSQFASGGFDATLAITDLNGKPQRLHSVALGSVVSSVKWPLLNQSCCVSCTLDEGHFMLFDIRQKIEKPTFQADLAKQELYAHERYSDYHVLLGFGDGEMQHLDMRVSSKILHRVKDPYVEGIGHIEFNSHSNAFVVSGFTDSTVWKQMSGGEAKVWSHMESTPNRVLQEASFTTFASFVDDKTIVVSSSAGGVGLYLQEWD